MNPIFLPNDHGRPRRFNIPTDAVLLRVSTTVWSGRSDNPVLSLATAHQAGAAQDSIESYIVLVEPTEIAVFNSIVNATWQWLDQNTVLWSKDWRLVASADYERVRGHLEGQKAQFLAAVDALVARRDELKANAKRRLKGLFSGFPSPRLLSAAFQFDIQRGEVKDDDADIRLRHVSPQVQADIEAEINQRFAAQTRDPLRQLLNCLLALAQRAAATPGDDGLTLHASLTGNVNAIIALVPALNTSGDPGITAITHEVGERLAKHAAHARCENAVPKKAVLPVAQSLTEKLRQIGSKV